MKDECGRCGYEKIGQELDEEYKNAATWCMQCKTYRRKPYVASNAPRRPKPRPIMPTKEDEECIKLAREELQAFRARGSPSIPRPYNPFEKRVMPYD